MKATNQLTLNNDRMDKQVNVVYATTDYDKFKFLSENREIDMARVNLLKESMKIHQLDKAIDVNENFEIIDGQHRFSAWRALHRPVIYTIHQGWGAQQIPVLNTNQKNWNPSDFLELYISMGLKDYEVYKTFALEHGYSHNVNLMLLARDGHEINGAFNAGEFKATKLTQAKILAEKIDSFQPFYAGYKRRGFVSAFMRVHKEAGYQHKKMLDKLRYQSRKLVDCTTADEFEGLLREIYNYKSRQTTTKL